MFKHGFHLFRLNPPQTIWFSNITGKLGDEDIRSNPDRAGNTKLFFNLCFNGIPNGFRTSKKMMSCGYIEERLINGISFHIRRELQIDFLKFLAGMCVFFVISYYKDNMWAYLFCLIDVHPCFY